MIVTRHTLIATSIAGCMSMNFPAIAQMQMSSDISTWRCEIFREEERIPDDRMVCEERGVRSGPVIFKIQANLCKIQDRLRGTGWKVIDTKDPFYIDDVYGSVTKAASERFMTLLIEKYKSAYPQESTATLEGIRDTVIRDVRIADRPVLKQLCGATFFMLESDLLSVARKEGDTLKTRQDYYFNQPVDLGEFIEKIKLNDKICEFCSDLAIFKVRGRSDLVYGIATNEVTRRDYYLSGAGTSHSDSDKPVVRIRGNTRIYMEAVKKALEKSVSWAIVRIPFIREYYFDRNEKPIPSDNSQNNYCIFSGDYRRSALEGLNNNIHEYSVSKITDEGEDEILPSFLVYDSESNNNCTIRVYNVNLDREFYYKYIEENNHRLGFRYSVIMLKSELRNLQQ